MADAVLQIWKLLLLAVLYLFFLRVLRAIWAQLRTPITALRPVNATVGSGAGVQTPPRTPREPDPGDRTITRLKIVEPKEQQGRTYELGDEITIGRAPGCKVHIDDTYVSQLHARVFRRDNQVLIEDLGSTNGTFCNGKKVAGPMPVQKGDRIQVGRTVMEAVR